MKGIKGVCYDPLEATSLIYITVLVAPWLRFCSSHLKFVSSKHSGFI